MLFVLDICIMENISQPLLKIAQSEETDGNIIQLETEPTPSKVPQQIVELDSSTLGKHRGLFKTQSNNKDVYFLRALDWNSLAIFAKSSILDIWLGSEYALDVYESCEFVYAIGGTICWWFWKHWPIKVLKILKFKDFSTCERDQF